MRLFAPKNDFNCLPYNLSMKPIKAEFEPNTKQKVKDRGIQYTFIPEVKIMNICLPIVATRP